MTTTARNMVRTSLISLGVAESGTQPDAQDLNDGLACLSRMIFAFKAKGFDVSALPLDPDDSLTPDYDQYEEGLLAMLAVRLAPEFGASVPPEVKRRADEGERLIMADFNVVGEMTFDRGLRMPSQGSPVNPIPED